MNIIGKFIPSNGEMTFDKNLFYSFIFNIRTPIQILFEPRSKVLGLATGGEIFPSRFDGIPLVATLPSIYPEWLGDRNFLETHNLRFAYVGGAMARGISSSAMVIELAKSGMMGFLGSAGMKLEQLENEVKHLSHILDPLGLSWGVNLIHTPHNLNLEEMIIDMYLKYRVRRISASAFLGVTPAIVRFSAIGLYKDRNGNIKRRNYIFAKISHPEIAKHFLSPAPEATLTDLVSKGKITGEEAELARQIPIAEDFDVEGDSGGHTDNRPLNVLYPTISNLRNELAKKYQYKNKIRLGAAGGIGTPQAVASAFALGASHIVLGSVHQSAVESGTSEDVKVILSKAGISDVMMTASADMFEMGVKVQVLKRGTMMGIRGNILYDIYKRYESIEEIPDMVRMDIEKNIFKMSLENVWEVTRKYFSDFEPAQVAFGESNPKYKMALVFRWYIGNSSRWPIVRETDRQMDYQIWCGPGMGAFNEWVKGTYLELPKNRNIRQIANNLLEGGAVITRAHQLRTYGLPLDDNAFIFKPERLEIG